MAEIRLQKYLAHAGAASRRKAEEWIRQGRISVNGKTVTEMGCKVFENDRVALDGKEIGCPEQKVYLMLHKPIGYVTTVKDQFGRASVVDLVKEVGERIYPVGRLDYDTSGLLLLTNDGEFTYRMTHPRHEVKKIYVAEIRGHPAEKELARFRSGLKIEDYITAPAAVEVLKAVGRNTLVEITIHEGRNRQVRKMCAAIGHDVLHLKRTAVGGLTLGDLPEGKWRYLSGAEVRACLVHSIDL